VQAFVSSFKSQSKKRGYSLPLGCKNIGDSPKPKFPLPVPDVPANKRISIAVVEVRDQLGNRLGIFRLEDALKRAQLKKLDLVLVDQSKTPPVCILIDYGKYKSLVQHGHAPRKWFTT
jgi:hypothetical protein